MTGTMRKLRVVKKDALTAVVYFTPSMLKIYMEVMTTLSIRAFFMSSLLQPANFLRAKNAIMTAATANLMEIM